MTNEELSFRTKQALAAALKTALERKKLSKITVSELAEACQVNRKTFYCIRFVPVDAGAGGH